MIELIRTYATFSLSWHGILLILLIAIAMAAIGNWLFYTIIVADFVICGLWIFWFDRP